VAYGGCGENEVVALKQLSIAVKEIYIHLAAAMVARDPTHGGAGVIARRRKIHDEGIGKAKKLKQRGVAQQVSQLLRAGGNNSCAVKRILQAGYLGKDGGQRGHLDIVPEEAA